MSLYIIWISNIHDLNVNESNYLSLDLLVNYLSRDCETIDLFLKKKNHFQTLNKHLNLQEFFLFK